MRIREFAERQTHMDKLGMTLTFNSNALKQVEFEWLTGYKCLAHMESVEFLSSGAVLFTCPVQIFPVGVELSPEQKLM